MVRKILASIYSVIHRSLYCDRGQKILICSERDQESPSEEQQNQQKEGDSDQSSGLSSKSKCKPGDRMCNYKDWKNEMYAVDKLPVWDGTHAKHMIRKGKPLPDVYSDQKPTPTLTTIVRPMPEPELLLPEPTMAPPYSRALHPPLPGWGEFTIIDSKGITVPVHPVDKEKLPKPKPHPADMGADRYPVRMPVVPHMDALPRTSLGVHMPAIRHASERDSKKLGDRKSGSKKAEDKKAGDTDSKE